MANQEHYKILKKGWEVWNEWRSRDVNPDLSGLDLSNIEFPSPLYMMSRILYSRHRFQGIDFSHTNLRNATIHANLLGADFGQADLTDANLEDSNLNYTNFEKANLSNAHLSRASISNSNLKGANLSEATLIDTKLEESDLSEADLTKAKLRGANLSRASLIKTNLEGADMTNSTIYGLSAWDVNISGTIQSNLVITPKNSPTVTVDNLEVAQFVYLLLNNQKIRDVINTIGQKAVLILGRFIPGRKEILDAIAGELRARGYLPIIFDFEKSQELDFTETIMILAGLSLFVIADITNPKCAPHELHATVPNYMIPFVPILQKGEPPYAMFRDLQGKYDWVLKLIIYKDKQALLNGLGYAVIEPALKKREEIIERKNRSEEPEELT